MPNLLDFMRDAITRAAVQTEMYRALTFIKVVEGTRNPAARTSGTQPVATNYSCTGMVGHYDDADVNGETIKDGDRRITILAASLVLPTGVASPAPGDRVIGDDGKTFEIVSVGRSASGAQWLIHGRG